MLSRQALALIPAYIYLYVRAQAGHSRIQLATRQARGRGAARERARRQAGGRVVGRACSRAGGILPHSVGPRCIEQKYEAKAKRRRKKTSQ